ncbi:RrF2 family transcriptional regulator [Calothrix sp. 336/3]|uniref:RrF2 family transcriptional regulator n=1 Tax=Calothrix sp. 336/3 TaxID=1337936 RepID=UPI00069A9E9E|nr:Rrf2 family transcriptional regulator [Calothrix sp. 336/3]
MGLSSRVEYAFLALMELADNYKTQNPLKIGEIAERHSLPERYLEQILSALRREGIIQSMRGAKGGYVMIREPWKITLQEAIAIVDGEEKAREIEISKVSNIEKSIIYEIWLQANCASQGIFKSFTIEDLCQQRNSYRQSNTMYYI